MNILNEGDMYKGNEVTEGKCPNCNSDNLEYGSMEIDSGLVCYPWTCEDCGAEGEEWFSLEFTGHNILIVSRYKEGDIVRILSDNECYKNYRDMDLKITSVAKSKSEHRGFDDIGQALYSLDVVETGEGVPFSLYDYELK